MEVGSLTARSVFGLTVCAPAPCAARQKIHCAETLHVGDSFDLQEWQARAERLVREAEDWAGNGAYLSRGAVLFACGAMVCLIWYYAARKSAPHASRTNAPRWTAQQKLA